MRLFFCPYAVNGNSIRLSLGAVSCFWATQGGNAFEAQVSVSPYWEKATWQYRRWLYAAFLTATLSASLCQPASAATVWEKANEIMRDVYTQILGISTIAAIVTAAVALLMMNFSRSGRTVDESRAWLKRIIITWAVLNGLGFIMSYVTPFFSGGQWTAS